MIGRKYIYDYKLADFAIQNGVKCMGTGMLKGNIYWMFDYDEIQPIYPMWHENAKLLKKS